MLTMNLVQIFQFLLIQHCLDVMHIERNISKNFLMHVFGEKDTPTMRRDMESVGKFLHLHEAVREIHQL
jgi:hypothetical protein